MKTQKFEEKFNYLLKEAETKLNIQNTSSLSANDLTKVDNTIKYLNSKKTEKCKTEIEHLTKHSSNFSKLENLEFAYAEKGQQKEFDEAKLKLEDCVKPINTLTESFKEHIGYFDNIIQGSFDLCLNNVKDHIKNGKADELISRSRIDDCYKYLVRSRKSSSEIIESLIEGAQEKY